LAAPAATCAAVAVVLLDTTILNVAGAAIRRELGEIPARREEP
jgi:hypothetical protein